jgi:hypothetical protein
MLLASTPFSAWGFPLTEKQLSMEGDGISTIGRLKALARGYDYGCFESPPIIDGQGHWSSRRGQCVGAIVR